MSNEDGETPGVLVPREASAPLSPHEQTLEVLAARRNLEALKLGAELLRVAGKVLQSREQQAELVHRQRLVDKEIERLQAERALRTVEADEAVRRLDAATAVLPRAIHTDLPALLAMLPDCPPGQRADIVREFLQRIPKVEIKA